MEFITQILTEKLVIHIPLQYWGQGELHDIPWEEPMDKLLETLGWAGFQNCFVVDATGYFRGRSYPEKLLTIFGGGELDAAEDLFMDWCAMYRVTLRQDSYAYERDGELHIFSIDEDRPED